MSALLLIILVLASTGYVLYQRWSLLIWTGITAVLLILFSVFSSAVVTLSIFWIIFLLIAISFNIPALRKILLTRSLFALYKKIMPKMSDTEREALDAGVVTWEAEMFAGKPNWKKLLNVPAATLTTEEQQFIDGPLNTLCGMIDEWEITQHLGDLQPAVWQYIKEQGFFAFIIKKQYGGLEFSPYAISRILVKLYGISISVASTVGVPNSLGPAELLQKYGTEAQKNYYLPRLAKGEEVPCFALTGPLAGSDAASIPDLGIVCMGEYEGKEVLGITLNFDKRYITLAPIASLIGLAFRLRDPQHLIGTVDDYGITCALLPRDLPGITIGRRHFPINQVFQNGPIQGHDVFIPLDSIIGGQKMAGKGWRMLMECLAEGRAVTLPSSAAGAALLCSYATGAYAQIRRQFNMPIGQFEGIEECLARIGGNTYLINASLNLTLSYMNVKEKSAVAAAIIKYHLTERSRSVITDAMDVQGGKGICLGPKNYLGRGYEGQPIAITVEGANILTRSMIIFGQGAIRCHPYVIAEMLAVQNNDLTAFDKAFTGHLGYVCSNVVRAFWLSVTNAYFVKSPVKDASRKYYKILTRYSATLALVADMAMFSMGGALKRKEKISARLGDILSYLYMGSAVLKRYHDEGAQVDDAPMMHWAMRDLMYNMQEAVHNLLRNFPNRLIAGCLRFILFIRGRAFSYPLDKYGEQVAKIMQSIAPSRQRLTAGVYTPGGTTHNLGLLQTTLEQVLECAALEKKVNDAYKNKQIRGDSFTQRVHAAQNIKIIDPNEAHKLIQMNELRLQVIAVDDFDSKELFPNAH
ncbi:MAG: acyl-CoA dehydrogenase [Gammaproteobacteria bacterium]|nr:acyl-CoA dehydrogenase [Gammaproteobacteria bacterium]